MQGRAITARGHADPAALQRLAARLRALADRRLPALALLFAAWAVIVLACARWAGARRRALRAGALGVLWAPCVALVTAALEPAAAAEYALIAGLALALGAATDALLRWPRALVAPALAAPLAILVDALARTQLLMRSLAGPDPAGGARFYGVGNELKSALVVMALARARPLPCIRWPSESAGAPPLRSARAAWRCWSSRDGRGSAPASAAP